MQQIFKLIENNSIIIIALLVTLEALTLVMLLTLWLRVRASFRPFRKLARGLKEQPLEALLHKYIEKADETQRSVTAMEKKCVQSETRVSEAITKLGLVRFNAFPDVGSDLSFALALLNQQGDGIVITSLYGRDESRFYAKPVQNGKSTYHLSREEEEAIVRGTR